jgi:uncharacterized protein (DUF736 family)
MADFDNQNRGVLFSNDKGDNPKRPDYKGSINVDGSEYWLSMWKKTSKSGQPFFSLSVEPKGKLRIETTTQLKVKC